MIEMENIRNQDGIGEKELLVVSFGTSFPESRKKTIGAIEDTLERQFGEYTVRRAFTSGVILRSIARKEGLTMDSISAALERAQKNGVKELLVQPTTMMNGFEYEKLVSLVREHSADFETVKIGAPLLSSDTDFDALIDAVTNAVQEYDDGKTAFVFMGHGTEAGSNRVYCQLQRRLHERGFSRCFVGTVEAEPTVQDVLQQIPSECRRVILEPLMIVAGDHANNDMAGDEEDSWKSVFSRAGFEVVCLLRGLGELGAVRSVFASHACEAKPLERWK